MGLIDTHCHIHDLSLGDRFKQSPEELYTETIEAGIEHVICVGTDVSSSQQAVAFSADKVRCSATIALHPHEVEVDKDIDAETVRRSKPIGGSK